MAGLSPEEEHQLNELLKKREMSQGLILPKAKASVSKAGGSMTDASKRQRNSADETSEHSFEHSEPPFEFEGQMKALMPDGVSSSLEQWGQVLITMPAMKDRNVTFAEAVEISK